MNQHLIHMSSLFESEGFCPDGAENIDLRAIEGTCCYCSEEASEDISGKMPSPDGLCWIDTGDYHYLSYLRARSIKEDFELVLFDNHTDDFDLCGTLSCGNWVTALRKDTGCRSTLFRTRKDFESWVPSGLPLFVSIDLDVLGEDEFKTNWDQGTMKYTELSEILRTIKEHHRIIGIDICGGITESKGASGRDLSLNCSLRVALLKELKS